MARLNPLVVSVTQSADDPHLYTIVDKIKLGGVIPVPSLPYTARFTSVGDGMDSEIEAMGIFKSRSQWGAKAIGEC